MTEKIFACHFKRGAWDPNQWWMVQSPRWNYQGRWAQEDDHIRNQAPEDLEEIGSHAPQAYTSMVYNQPLTGAFAARATLSFDLRMAPSIVLAAPPEHNSQNGREYRHHFEIVFFDQGINLWHHQYIDGQPSWILAAYWRLTLAPKTRYAPRVIRQKNALDITLEGREFGCFLPALPDVLYAGVTACEGINRFYSFELCTV